MRTGPSSQPRYGGHTASVKRGRGYRSRPKRSRTCSIPRYAQAHTHAPLYVARCEPVNPGPLGTGHHRDHAERGVCERVSGPFLHDHEEGAEEHPASEVGRRAVGADETVRANRRWWDAAADDYQSEHGDFLGGRSAARFIWGPEGLDEADAELLGPVARLGGAQSARGWLRCGSVLRVVGRAGRCLHRHRPVDASADPRRPAPRRQAHSG